MMRLITLNLLAVQKRGSGGTCTRSMSAVQQVQMQVQEWDSQDLAVRNSTVPETSTQNGDLQIGCSYMSHELLKLHNFARRAPARLPTSWPPAAGWRVVRYRYTMGIPSMTGFCRG
jgi:hypothetical protein